MQRSAETSARLSSYSDGEHLCVTSQHVELLPHWEQFTELGRLYSEWSSYRHNPRFYNGPPMLEEFKPTGEMVHRARVHSENPYDYLVQPTDGESQIIVMRAVKKDVILDQMRDDLMGVKHHNECRYQIVEVHRGRVEHVYRRLFLPVTDDSGKVVVIYIILREVGSLGTDTSLLARPEVFSA